ncbi:hypothetical protein ABIC45_002965 [Mucilaginibacter rubeus]|uniref:DUF262 domain-containing protein n=1 Tax=Mucilaginibacter rubeus TaxID=2027860 RepID=UPI0033993AC9
MNKYNLHDVLTKELEIISHEEKQHIKFDGIRIPMIQRDYAQGRKDEKEVRGHFLTEIFSALNNGTPMELDFVYGAVKTQDKSTYFVPLDGQQRLTTLFLLYWYIGQRELDPAAMSQRQDELARFSYDTRPSARDFCLALCKLDKCNFKLQPPAALIRDTSWFYTAFDLDPTVKAMLVMLDAIHEQYKQCPAPVDANLSLLQFYILPLNGFGLSDELYIKMNARGKPLTDFENFKADLINWMTDKHNPEADLFMQAVKYNEREMPYAMAISLKLDNDWTNFFWQFTKNEEEEKDKLVDPLFLRFINRYLLNELILTSPLTQDALEKSDPFSYFYHGDQKSHPVKYTNFRAYANLLGNYKTIQKIERILDNMCRHYAEICSLLAPSWKPSERWHFFADEISQTQRILFLGLCGFLQHAHFEATAFKQWIRVVWNIIINPDIRSIRAMMSAMKLIADLTDHSGDIYLFLTGESAVLLEEKHSFTEFKEERIKAGLITTDGNWEAALINAEAHPLFQGSVGFMLTGHPAIPEFEKRYEMANQLFMESGAKGIYAKEHLLMRAMISKVKMMSQLEELKMEDSGSNWALLLRRNSSARKIICAFCSSHNETELLSAIQAAIVAGSALMWHNEVADATKIRHVHEQLYQIADFHQWMQDRNAVGLVRRDEHFYIKKYRAWYDMVMLDTYRNELIDLMIKRFDLHTGNRCANTNFFWGYSVSLNKQLFGFQVTFEFNQYRFLKIGLKKEQNYLPEGLELPESMALKDHGWHICQVYDYLPVHSVPDAVALTDRIAAETCDEKTPGSLYQVLAGLSETMNNKELTNG